MHLNRNRDHSAACFREKLTNRENWEQIIIAILEVQIESFKAFPRYHGYRESIIRFVGLGVHRMNRTIFFKIPMVIFRKCADITVLGCPKIWERFGIFVKNGIARNKLVIYTKIPFFADDRAKFFMLINYMWYSVQHNGYILRLDAIRRVTSSFTVMLYVQGTKVW